MFHGHSEKDIEFTLATAIEAVDSALVLNLNSRRLWSTLAKSHRRLDRGRSIGSMVFCDDQDAAGTVHSYLRNSAGGIARSKIAAIGDSGPYFDSVFQTIGIPGNRRVPMHFPPLVTVRSTRTKQNYERTSRMMWSGRFDTRKRIDIATALARIASHLEFHVCGFPMLDSDETLMAALNALPDVVNFGKYDSFGEIDIDQYDALVITTQWEGCPNVVLEAGLRGLSVVAPDVSGIGEALGGGRGFLSTSTFDDVDTLAEQLLLCCADRREAIRRAVALRDDVNATHTDAEVIAGIQKIEAME
jgi:glycosyltransferase involved in cell wall biosynthesis